LLATRVFPFHPNVEFFELAMVLYERVPKPQSRINMEPAIRPYSSPDAPAVLDLLTSTMTADSISETRFARQVLLDPNFRTDGALVAEKDNQIVGFLLAIARQTPLENAPSDSDRGYITLFGVHPQHQRQGIASKLLERAESYLRSQNHKQIMIASYAPGYFLPGVDVHAYAPALKFLAKHNYKEVYRPLAMQTPLWSLAIPEWVHQKERDRQSEGYRFEAYTPSLTLSVLDFTKKEFPGDWVRVVRQVMDRILQGDSPTRLFIAHRSSQVVGFSHYENERFGPIGTASNLRGQGLGQILMYKTLAAQRDAGFRSAWFLWSDDPTAKKIYSAAGFTEVRRFALMKREL
jgi:mycothiol synthase